MGNDDKKLEMGDLEPRTRDVTDQEADEVTGGMSMAGMAQMMNGINNKIAAAARQKGLSAAKADPRGSIGVSSVSEVGRTKVGLKPKLPGF